MISVNGIKITNNQAQDIVDCATSIIKNGEAADPHLEAELAEAVSSAGLVTDEELSIYLNE